MDNNDPRVIVAFDRNSFSPFRGTRRVVFSCLGAGLSALAVGYYVGRRMGRLEQMYYRDEVTKNKVKE